MNLLSGEQLVGPIKDRQTTKVQTLKNQGVAPKLAIIQCKDDPVINTYVKLKKAYGQEIGVIVDIHRISQDQAFELINRLNADQKVHGIIIQLPLPDTSGTDRLVNLVASAKDVDGLGKFAKFEPATPMAILWLLEAHNINLSDKKVLVIGRGRLVGGPLEKVLRRKGINVVVTDKANPPGELAPTADVIISATGQPGILTSEMIKSGAIIIDAGVSSEEGKTLGDASPEVYKRSDIRITPPKGGVGPLTVCALFENTILAAKSVITPHS